MADTRTPDVVECDEVAQHIVDMLGYMRIEDFGPDELRQLYNALRGCENRLQGIWEREGL